jgi:hypothetical protein
MTFNPEKCTVMHVTNKKKPTVTKYRLHDNTVEKEQHCKNLGITISLDLKWNTYANKTKANRSRGNLGGCRPTINVAGYNAIVRPTLEYAATVWNPDTNQLVTSVEKVQRRAARS